jgi:hypothetical protein
VSPVLGGLEAISLFEILYETTLIIESNSEGNLFNRQKGGLQEFLCLLESHHFDVLHDGHAEFDLEQVM